MSAAAPRYSRLRGTDCIAEVRSPRSSSSRCAKEIGSRGVTVNSILPTAIEGAGVYTSGASEEVMQFVRSFRPIRRMGTLDDVTNAAEYLVSDLAGFISGQHLLLSGGGPA